MYLPPQIVFSTTSIYNERSLWGSNCAATNSDYSAEKPIPCKKINASTPTAELGQCVSHLITNYSLTVIGLLSDAPDEGKGHKLRPI